MYCEKNDFNYMHFQIQTFNMCMRNDFMFYTFTKLDWGQSCSMGVKEGTPVGVLFPQFVAFVEARFHSA